MRGAPHNHLSDLRGASRLAVDATTGLAGLVEAMHASIARVPTRFGGPLVGGAVNGITRLVYQSIDGVTRVVGGGIDAVLAAFVPMLGHMEPSPARDALVAALNGVLGDHLAETGNPLAISMQLRSAGKPVQPTPCGLAAAFPRPAPRIVVLVHGLCMNDVQWTRQGHDHGAGLARDLGYAPIYVRYNTGRHISTNGRALTAMLEALVADWPVPVEDLTIVTHSMGGLVSRSAHHYGTLAGHAWPRRLRRLVFLGTPHHGAPLERGGHRLHALVERTPIAGHLSRLGRIRSAGITDLRHGNVVDEDWTHGDRFTRGEDARRPMPLPDGVECFAIAATRGRAPGDLRCRVFGDGLVPVRSALGYHRDPRFALAFPAAHQWIACRAGHFDLLSRSDVYARISAWLAR
jgi:hypothetical protein